MCQCVCPYKRKITLFLCTKPSFTTFAVKLNLEGYSPTNLQYLMQGDTRQDEAEDAIRFQSWKSCLGMYPTKMDKVSGTVIFFQNVFIPVSVFENIQYIFDPGY